jgi:DNA modification methylase
MRNKEMITEVVCRDCVAFLSEYHGRQFDLTFLDPPFNQGKDYNHHNDAMPEDAYWEWMTRVCWLVLQHSSKGAALYFMQREKNSERVLRAVREAGWFLQNIIIWKKKTSAIPGNRRYGKQYQIIAFATNGERPKVFNKLRIDPPLPSDYRYKRDRGIFVTDVWDDIRELTAGYFAGDEALRDHKGDRVHKQQSPIQLLLRIILSSSLPGDVIFDPFAGTGTTTVVAQQLARFNIGIDIDPINIEIIKRRLINIRKSDDLLKYAAYYRFSDNLKKVWGEVLPDEIKKITIPELSLQYEDE